jgi:hypothetical protein
MWRVFSRLGPGDDVESNVIAEASNRLDVGEFEFFELSYEHWYGERPDEGRIEPHFFAYLMRNEPPPWARHFARRIIALDDGGALDSEDPQFHRFDRGTRAPSKWTGWSVVCLTLAVVVAFLCLIVLGDSAGLPGHCMFPPCP